MILPARRSFRRDNALTEAVNDMKKAESDINRRVMMENPWPEAGKEGGPGVIPDDKTAPAVSGESASSEKSTSTGEEADAAPDSPSTPDDDGKKAASS